MNKYQEALANLHYNARNYPLRDKDNETIQELVDKEMPMKTLHISLLSNPAQNIIACGNCKGNNLGQSFKYCPSCRQKIDWNDEE